MRRFSVPTNPGSDPQVLARNRLSAASAEWRTLTDNQRDAWSSWALTHPVLDRLGASLILTGHQAFVRCWVNDDIVAGSADLTTPPAEPAYPAALLGDTITIDASSGTVAATAKETCAISSIYAIWASPPVSPGVSNITARLRLLNVITLAAERAAAAAITEITSAAYIAVFGSLTGAEGKKITYVAYPYDACQFGGASSISGVVVA